MEVRLDHAELGQVAVAAVRVVREDDVARARGSPAPISLIAAGIRCTVEPIIAGQNGACAAISPLAVEDEAREVERLVEHRRVARPHHRDAHLACRW